MFSPSDPVNATEHMQTNHRIYVDGRLAEVVHAVNVRMQKPGSVLNGDWIRHTTTTLTLVPQDRGVPALRRPATPAIAVMPKRQTISFVGIPLACLSGRSLMGVPTQLGFHVLYDILARKYYTRASFDFSAFTSHSFGSAGT